MKRPLSFPNTVFVIAALCFATLACTAITSLVEPGATAEVATAAPPTDPPPTAAQMPAATAPTDPATQPPTAAPSPDNKPPVEAILITSIANGSKVVSPVHVNGIADPVFESTLQVEVRDERGVILGIGIGMIHADIGQRGPFEAVVEFIAPTAPQRGRISVFSVSARDGHVTHLSSVEVDLLPASATPDIKPAPNEHPESIGILSPALSEVISGGKVSLKGVAAPTFEQTLSVAVLDGSGNVVGSGLVNIEGDVGQAGRFAGEVAYAVTSEQPGSVQVYAISPRDGNIIHLTSVEVTLKP